MEDGEAIKNIVVRYFSELFRAKEWRQTDFMSGAFPRLEVEIKEEMEKEVTLEETKRVLWGMRSYKAPGPDGYQAVFFKKARDKLGGDVHGFVKGIMEGGEIKEDAAQALLVLIPKETKPNNMRSFRPLSLCNTACKVVVKVLVNRLMEAWKTLISPYQASFVPGHKSNDNVIICNEFGHSFRYTRARRGAMMIKVDLENVLRKYFV